MSPVCSSGISGPRTGTAAAVVVDQDFIQALLPPALAWLYPYLPWMHGLAVGDVGAFCLADPPTFTVPTSLDIYALITNGSLLQSANVVNFMQDVTRYYLWYRLCECKSVATPAAAAPPSAPTDLPAVNPPGVAVLPYAAPCAHDPQANRGSWASGGAQYNLNFISGSNFPVGATTLVYDITSTVAGAVHTTVQVRFQFISSPDPAAVTPVIGEHFFNVPSGAHVVETVPIPQGTTAILFTGLGGSAVTDTIFDGFDIYCGVAPGAAACTPCAPDPSSRRLLESIYALLQDIQRTYAPFGYLTGTTHAALTGTGSVGVSRNVGLKVTLTATPIGTPTIGGNPLYIKDVGWMSISDADGMIEELRIARMAFTWFPPRMTLATAVNYFLPAGVVATITELLPEPV